jgi:ribonuclease P protein component
VAATQADKQSFERCDRLLLATDFDLVFKNGRRSSDQWFTILFTEGAAGRPRLGLAIAKRRVRKANQRNRIKRVARESFRQVRAEMPAADVVVMAGSRAADASNAELFGSLDRHWNRIAKVLA